MPPARALWKGAISFGMVTIPVQLFSATEQKDISFHLLHREDNSRLKFVRTCPVHEREVTKDEIVRGYEFAKGQYVILEDEDFETLPVASKHTIEISAFIDAEEIPPLYHERGYFLEPQETGVKAYRLLLTALENKGLVAVGKIAFRQREHLCALRPGNGAVLLETLFYADEVRPVPQIPEAPVSERELEMAYALIDLLREPFDASKYEDEYRVALVDLIEAKQAGQAVVVEPVQQETKVVDLMEALRASVEAARKPEAETSAPKRAGRKAG
jgi:DNA end-binding protein Ku